MNLIKKISTIILLFLIIIFLQRNVSKATTVEVTTETLNLRKEASTESDIVALISEGDECEVLDDEGDWYKVQYGEYTGYISKEYTEVISGSSSDSSNNSSSSDTSNDTDKETVDDNTVSSDTDKTETNKENTETNTTSKDNNDEATDSSTSQTGEGRVNKNTQLRITPLINSSVIEELKSGVKVTVINQINGWSYIYTDETAGWVRSDMLTIASQKNSVNKEENTDSKNNTDKKEDNSNKKEEESSETSFEEKTMYTNDSAVNIRAEASTDADIIMVVELNTELKVIGEEGDWYKAETSQGDAYVSKDLLSSKKTAVTTSRGSGKTDNKVEAKATTSTSSSAKGKEVVSYAKKFLGVPYVYGGASPSGFDCSGFTMYAYKKVGISMPHGAQSQSRLGKKISTNKSSKSSILNNLKAGDLVFFLDYQTMDEIGHCGIYIGDGKFIHASSGSGYCVKIDNLLPGNYYNTRYCAARRVI